MWHRSDEPKHVINSKRLCERADVLWVMGRPIVQNGIGFNVVTNDKSDHLGWSQTHLKDGHRSQKEVQVLLWNQAADETDNEGLGMYFKQPTALSLIATVKEHCVNREV
jgi:hypothetical protein